MVKLVLNTTTDILTIEVGSKVKLHDGTEGVVDENMGDGQWLSCKMDGEDMPALVHSQDLAEVHSPK